VIETVNSLIHNSMHKAWKQFERVVAAIHVAESQGATVTWNEDINGRQFDVVIRFKFQFYDYLVLIECKDLQRAVEVKEVDAFVTKSKDAKANKSIMVSSKGFQSGATEVAQRHNIELYTLTQVQEMPEDLFTDQVASVLIVWPVGFRKTGSNEIIHLSKDENKLRWEINNIKMKGFGDLSLAQVLGPFAQLLAPFEIPGVPKFGGTFRVATKEKQKMALTLMSGTRVIFPFTEEEIPVSHLLIIYWMASTRLTKPSLLDLTIFKDLGIKYDYKNVLTEEHTILDGQNLPLGVDTQLEAGKFYTQPGLKFFFYCEKTSATQAFLALIESYQHGHFVTASIVVPIPAANPYYIEITEPNEIERLKKLYERFKS
jgi:hypothetical protein